MAIYKLFYWFLTNECVFIYKKCQFLAYKCYICSVLNTITKQI